MEERVTEGMEKMPNECSLKTCRVREGREKRQESEMAARLRKDSF